MIGRTSLPFSCTHILCSSGGHVRQLAIWRLDIRRPISFGRTQRYYKRYKPRCGAGLVLREDCKRRVRRKCSGPPVHLYPPIWPIEVVRQLTLGALSAALPVPLNPPEYPKAYICSVANCMEISRNPGNFD